MGDAELREALDAIVPTLKYALLQAEMTFDPLVRDGHAGGKQEHRRMVKAEIAGTPSLLTLKLRDALEMSSAALSGDSRANGEPGLREAIAQNVTMALIDRPNASGLSWNEAKAIGVDVAARVTPPAALSELDAAWVEAESAIRPFKDLQLQQNYDGTYTAISSVVQGLTVVGPTPATALRSLASRLRALREADPS